MQINAQYMIKVIICYKCDENMSYISCFSFSFITFNSDYLYIQIWVLMLLHTYIKRT